jgi:hypothetical protein
MASLTPAEFNANVVDRALSASKLANVFPDQTTSESTTEIRWTSNGDRLPKNYWPLAHGRSRRTGKWSSAVVALPSRR